MVHFKDKPETPPIYESEAKIREEAKDAISYLKRKDAEDLIDILGLEDNGSERGEDASHKTSGRSAGIHRQEFGRTFQRNTRI